MHELVGIIVFSAFMAALIILLVGNLLLAIYRERRKTRSEAHDGPLNE
jgi:cbb3-type cytochrome oxidase subunit 3